MADLRQRNLAAARSAFSQGDLDEDALRQLSREAHGGGSGPSSPFVNAKPSAGASLLGALSESGHNAELENRGTILLLRGAVDGLVLSLSILALGDAAGWQASRALRVDAALLCCWALFSACKEALEIITYRSYYERERRREAWGASSRRRAKAQRAPALPLLPRSTGHAPTPARARPRRARELPRWRSERDG